MILHIQIPTLKCAHEEEKFTCTKSSVGNKDIKYPVALITAGEASFAD